MFIATNVTKSRVVYKFTCLPGLNLICTRDSIIIKKKGLCVGLAPFRVPIAIGKGVVKERGPEPRPLLQATILFHLRGHLMKS
jgi:hypothetical protein